VGSKTFDGIRFSVYTADHLPRHAYGFSGDTTVVVDLLENNLVRKSSRRDAVRPGNAKENDVRRILNAAAEHVAELNELWERTHGTSSK